MLTHYIKKLKKFGLFSNNILITNNTSYLTV